MEESRPVFGEKVTGRDYIIRPGVYAVIFADDNRVAALAGSTGLFLPGGGSEDGENHAETLARELREECGAEIQILESVGEAVDFLHGAAEDRFFEKRGAFYRARFLTPPDGNLVWTPVCEARRTFRQGGHAWAVAQAAERRIAILPAQISDAPVIADALREAAAWLAGHGKPLWSPDQFGAEKITPEAHLYFLARAEGEVAGVFKLEETDPLFWPDLPPDDSLFLHKLVVRRAWSGTALSTALLRHAAGETSRRGKTWLRLDCEASRAPLRAIYERFGFRHHSDRQVGHFHAARYEYAVP